jgi:hypothetical protein
VRKKKADSNTCDLCAKDLVDGKCPNCETAKDLFRNYDNREEFPNCTLEINHDKGVIYVHLPTGRTKLRLSGVSKQLCRMKMIDLRVGNFPLKGISANPNER